MSIASDIIGFAGELPDWQKDLARRIARQTDLSDSDRGEVLDMLRAAHGVETDGELRPSEPIAEGDIPNSQSKTKPVVLNSLGDVQGIDRLAEGETLNFANRGLTIVFGENGSGKSGYVRILKALCGVRAGGEQDLLPNVYAEGTQPTSKVSITYVVGSADPISLRWTSDDAPPVELSAIRVFDAVAMPLYADRESKLEFLPAGLDIFHRLAEETRMLRDVLAEETETLKARLPALPPTGGNDSEAGRLVASLTDPDSDDRLPTEKEIRELAVWSADDKEALKKATSSVQGDPLSQAKTCQQIADHAEELAREAQELEATFGETAVIALGTQLETASAARGAANEVAKRGFVDEPLGNVGSDLWRRMIGHAREYVRDLPGSASDASIDSLEICPLCQQGLGADAAHRLERFEDFLSGQAQVDALEAEKKRDELMAAFRGANIRSVDNLEAILQNVESFDPNGMETRAASSTFFEAAKTQQDTVVAALNAGTPPAATPLPESPADELHELSVALIDEVAGFKKAGSDTEERARLRSEHAELQDRKSLSDSIEVVVDRRNSLERLRNLKQCDAACSTRDISLANSKLREKHLGGQLTEGLRAELESLGLRHLEIRMRERTEGGESLAAPELLTPVRVSTARILSGGEYSMLGLACFLAEAERAPDQTLVIDDPVSSIDQAHTALLAKRLVGAAAQRQVIVFTHDAVFLYDIQGAATEAGINLTTHWIRQMEETGPGKVFDDMQPWAAQRVKARIKTLRRRLDEAEQIDSGEPEKYLIAVSGFYTALREAWERLVEETLLRGVVERFKPEVHTQKLRDVHVTDGDYYLIFDAMSRASKYSGHDKAVSSFGSLPTKEDMREDLKKLDKYRQSLEERRKDRTRPETGQK